MWDKIYRVIRKTSVRQDDILLRNSDGHTLTPQLSSELLARTFYPDDAESTDQQCHTALREQTAETPTDLPDDDPPFTSAELESVLRNLNPKKAPGPDGLTADICAAAIRCNWELFMAIANKCLSLRYFPKQWKEAHVVILRKPGKEDYTHPKSYRPIGLLSVLGKIVEKLLVGRLQWHLLPTLSSKQYGFMPQRGTEDALYDLVEHIKEGVQSKNIVLLISLDIEGAFDNAWWPALKHQLAKKRCPKNLYDMVNSYLSNRKIKVNYARTAYEKETTKGCVQGSIGGPTFWNVILDSLLRQLEAEEVYCQAFADDVVLVFTGQSNTLEQQANKTLDMVVEWGNRNKLNFAAHKTSAMLFTRKLKYETPNLVMSGVRLNLVEEIKLLGLVIDRRLTFKSHITAQCKKAAEIYKQMACTAKVTWGLNSEIIRTMYVAVVEPIIMYASSVWAPAIDLEVNRSHLNALQRGFAQKICKSYRTVSLTSALALSGLLPLDLRIQEAASLYKAKKSVSSDYLPPKMKLEKRVSPLDQPHPSTQTSVDFEFLEDIQTQLKGPQIYTDGSKIEGQVGAALSWWENGKEVRHSTFGLHPECTVFQSELYALYRATQLVMSSKDPQVSVLSDSRSSLELLRNPKTSHPLVKGVKENIERISAEGRSIRLFWLRAHVGTAGNERADELAKSAALTGASQDYEGIPLSFVKKKIREESIRKWQDRFETSVTGAVTRKFLPDIAKAYRLTRTTKLTPYQVQALTGHGGIAEYLYRFKLKETPGCECDPDVPETVWHVLLECPRFLAARRELECLMDRRLVESDLSNILADPDCRPHFLSFTERSFRIAAQRNSAISPPTNITPLPTDATHVNPQHHHLTPKSVEAEQLLAYADRGVPGIRIRGVALFMEGNRERFGMSFCLALNKKRARLSPGLACLLNGSTSKVTMKRKAYDALPVLEVLGHRCRLVRSKNKTIALFEWTAQTPFAQVSSLLTKLSDCADSTPRVISVDAMVIEYSTGETADRLGCIKASEHHEVVVYEDRGENLSYLRTPTHDRKNATDSWGHPVPSSTAISGSERAQQKTAAEEAAARRGDSREKGQGPISTFFTAFHTAAQSLFRVSPRKEPSPEKKSPREAPPPQQAARTKADMGQVSPPRYIPALGPSDHARNAFLEFLAITRATTVVNLRNCENILQSFRQENEGLLNVRLEEADAAIYNNDTSLVIKGTMKGRYMAAYNSESGFVALDESETERTGKPKYETPPNDPIVVIARCTKIMLDDRILEMAKTIEGSPGVDAKSWEGWEVPAFRWINGVPGCGKTTWVVRHFDVDKDVIITTTTEAAKDLREKLAHRIGDLVKTKVRTMASVLVNGIRRGGSNVRLMVDEALMNHFGAIVMAARLAGAREIVLIGDVNQLPYIDRENLFELRYDRPNLVATINQELLCTHRNPMDVAYALREIYSGIYSSAPRVRSLEQRRYTGAQIPSTLPNTLFLVHTQEEKETLSNQGYGGGTGSRIQTIHEAQGLTYESVIVIKTKGKMRLHGSVPHAVVAVSRHTGTFVYYADDEEDAISRFVRRAKAASPKAIREYNMQMAIKDRNVEVTETLGREEQAD